MYTVEISPPAWNQLAHLRVETYRRIRDALDAVAAALPQSQERASSRPVKQEGYGSSLPSVVVDDAIALYDVDHQRRRVVLLEVARRLPRLP